MKDRTVSVFVRLVQVLWIRVVCLHFLELIALLPAVQQHVSSNELQTSRRSLMNLLVSVGAVSTVEYNSLYELYQQTNGVNWNWYNTTPPTIPWNFATYSLDAPCSDKWQGITCSCTAGKCEIINLDLSAHNVTGQLPESIGGLNALTKLIFNNNALNGTIPESIRNFTAMNTLSFNQNHLVGTIPQDIEKMRHISQLTFSSNNLSGTIPDEIFTLTNLTALELDFNSFYGTLSSSIGNLTNLEFLKLGENNFHGTLPRSIGKLTQITHLMLSFNNFSSSLPQELFQLNKMEIIYLSNNQFTGTISPEIGNWVHLQGWFSYLTNLGGRLPEALFNPLMPIKTFDIEENLFSGPFPRGFVNWNRSLQTIFASSNSFTGTIPSNLTFQILYSCQMNSNFLYGTVDKIFSNISTMTYLDWSDNAFTGPMPSGYWPVLVFYITSLNYFTGSIPTQGLSNTDSLYYLDVAFNHLSGSIPKIFHTVVDSQLSYVNFSYNSLTGNLNQTFGGLNSLLSLSLSYNQLTQSIPFDFGNIPNLIYLFLDSNQLGGYLPKSIKNLRKLKVLFLQNNLFSGTIANMFFWNTLENADVSNNQFSGSLPLFVSDSPKLKTFAASSNCFSGSLPEMACNLTSIQVLSLDGLATASHCRLPLFPGSSLLTAFSLESSFTGGIPECFFQMPNLQTLHLSGNGFTGTLPDNLQISNSLMDLTISHNLFSGTIPVNFQQKQWTNFDLSYNRFTGTLTNSFHNFNSSATLDLEVNRLSGAVPSSILSAENIDLVEGNMFSCNYNRNDLPTHDSKTKNYSCGSDVVNAAFYCWISIMMCVLLLILICRSIRLYFQFSKVTSVKRFVKFLENIVLWRTTFVHFCETSREHANSREANAAMITRHQSSDIMGSPTTVIFPMPPADGKNKNSGRSVSSSVMEYGRIYKLYLFFQKLRLLFLILTVFMMFVLLPYYGIISHFYHEFYFTYAWTLSGLLMTGVTAGTLLLTIFLLIILLLIVFYKALISPYKTDEIQNINDLPPPAVQQPSTSDERSTNSPAQQNTKTQSIIGRSTSMFAKSLYFRESIIKENINYLSYLSLMLVGLFNCIIMVAADILYVYVILNYNTTIILIAEILLAMFKILNNNTLLWLAIPYIRDCLDKDHSSRNSLFSSTSLDTDEMSMLTSRIKLYQYTVNDLSFLSLTILLNNIVFPAIAILIVSPDCFYNAFFAASDVSSSYTYEVCARYSALDDGICLQYLSYPVNSSYSPPFIYSYQCASIIIINYAAVFVLMFTFEGVIQPLFKLFVKFIYDGYLEDKIVITLVESKPSFHNPHQSFSESSLYEIPASIQPSFAVSNPMQQTTAPALSVPQEEKVQSQQQEKMKSGRLSLTFRSSLNIVQNEKDDKNIVDQDLSRNSFRPSKSYNVNNNYDPESPSKIRREDIELRDTIVTNRRTMLAVTLKTNTPIKWYYRALFYFLPYNLTHLIPEPSYEIKTALILFDKNRIIVRLTAYLVVFMSFGVLFPPLAFITCLTAFSLTLYEEMVIGRILYESEKFNFPWYKKQIDRNCSGISNSLKYSLWTLVPVSCFLYAYIIFDTFGNDIAWSGALLPTLVMILLPVLFLFLWSKRKEIRSLLTRIANYWRSWNYKRQRKSERQETISADSSKIPSVILGILKRRKRDPSRINSVENSSQVASSITASQGDDSSKGDEENNKDRGKGSHTGGEDLRHSDDVETVSHVGSDSLSAITISHHTVSPRNTSSVSRLRFGSEVEEEEEEDDG
jgi:Leucine-rich repeat (LRR) protein